MNKKEILILIAIAALSLLFSLVSLMVFITNGKSRKWVAYKMKIGGLLISLSLYSCGNEVIPNAHIEGQATCYVVISDFERTEYTIELDSNKTIYGDIKGYRTGQFSYVIVDNNGILIQKDNLFTRRYSFDPKDGEFIVELNQKLDTGKYQFKIYDCKLKEQDPKLIIYKSEFIIKNK